MTEKEPSPALLDSLMSVRQIPAKANIRREAIKCGKRNCSKCPHGGYLYAYWWENGAMRKSYVGKSIEAYNARLLDGILGMEKKAQPSPLCDKCGAWFVDADSLKIHIEKEHITNLDALHKTGQVSDADYIALGGVLA